MALLAHYTAHEPSGTRLHDMTGNSRHVTLTNGTTQRMVAGTGVTTRCVTKSVEILGTGGIAAADLATWAGFTLTLKFQMPSVAGTIFTLWAGTTSVIKASVSATGWALNALTPTGALEYAGRVPAWAAIGTASAGKWFSLTLSFGKDGTCTVVLFDSLGNRDYFSGNFGGAVSWWTATRLELDPDDRGIPLYDIRLDNARMTSGVLNEIAAVAPLDVRAPIRHDFRPLGTIPSAFGSWSFDGPGASPNNAGPSSEGLDLLPSWADTYQTANGRTGATGINSPLGGGTRLRPAITVSFWMMVGPGGRTGEFMTIGSPVARPPDTDIPAQMSFSISQLDGLRMQGPTSGRVVAPFVGIPGATQDVNVWLHFAYVRDGRYDYAYRNGELVNSYDYGETWSATSYPDLSEIWISETLAPNTLLVDDLRIYSQALTDTQVRGLYQAPADRLVNLGGAATLSATRRVAVKAALRGTGTVSTTVTAAMVRTAAATGTGTLTAVAVGSVWPIREGAFGGTATLTATGSQVAFRSASFSGAGTLSAKLRPWFRPGLSGEATLTASDPLTIVAVDVDPFSGTASLTAKANIGGTALAEFRLTGALSADREVINEKVPLNVTIPLEGNLAAAAFGRLSRWRFTTPQVRFRPDVGDRLFSRVAIYVGVSLLKSHGLYRQVANPSDEEVAAADVAYLGGHVYLVDERERADLIGAGYGALVGGVVDP